MAKHGKGKKKKKKKRGGGGGAVGFERIIFIGENLFGEGGGERDGGGVRALKCCVSP